MDNELTYKEHLQQNSPYWVEKDGVFIKSFETYDEAETYKTFHLCDECVIVDRDKS